MREALEAVHRRAKPKPAAVVLPPGLDRAVLCWLPFRIRTWNCLRAAGLFEGDAVVAAESLLQLRNFGVVSLRDLLLVVEGFLHQCTRNNHTASPAEQSQSSAPENAQGDLSVAPWDRVIPSLRRLLAAAAEFRGAATLVDVLTPDTIRMASQLGIEDDLRALVIGEIVQPSDSLSSAVLARAKQMYASFPNLYRTVLSRRVLATAPVTLAEVATEVGRSRERIRQIQVRLERLIDEEFGVELHMIATVLKDDLGPMARESEVDQRIQGLINDLTPAGALARHAVKTKLGYRRS